MANVSDKFPDVFQYILSEETNYRTRRVPLAQNWDWSMYEHVDRSFTLLNSQFTQGDNTGMNRPFNNIILPIRAVSVRSEGFDVKDVEIFVDNKDNYHKSLLTKKFHTRWALKYSIDTAIDESVESYFDYGVTIVKNVNNKRPEVVQPQQLAFCDTTDILSGPICLKHQYSIADLLEMKGKWQDAEIDRAIRNASFEQQRRDEKETKTPGKYIEVYELHGVFPDGWLEDGYSEEVGSYSPQMHIITYYTDMENNEKTGICLYKGKEPKPIFKVLKRDSIFGRACGRGGIEELFHPQLWTNYSEIHLQQNLEAVSKVVLQTADKKLAKNQKMSGIKHNTILGYEKEMGGLEQVIIQAPNIDLFERNYVKWQQQARTIGSASDPQLGINPVSGTPLGTTEIVTNQGQGIHEYRRGKIATFWGEIYRDWVLNYLKTDMLEGDEWVEELEVDELREVAQLVVTNRANKKIKEKLQSGEMVTKEDQAQMKQMLLDSFAKTGKRQFLKLAKDEIKDIPIDVRFNIAGKQSNQAEMVQKLNSIFRTVFANPAILQNEGMAELFNDILENAGLSPLNFSAFTRQQVQEQQQQLQPEVAPSNAQPQLAVA